MKALIDGCIGDGFLSLSGQQPQSAGDAGGERSPPPAHQRHLSRSPARTHHGQQQPHARRPGLRQPRHGTLPAPPPRDHQHDGGGSRLHPPAVLVPARTGPPAHDGTLRAIIKDALHSAGPRGPRPEMTPRKVRGGDPLRRV